MHAVKLSCTQNVGLKQKFPRKCLHRSTKLNRMINNKRFLCLMNATTLLLSHAFFRKLLSSFTLLLTTLSGDTVQLNSGNSLTLSLCGFHLRFLCVNFSKMLSKFSQHPLYVLYYKIFLCIYLSYKPTTPSKWTQVLSVRVLF